MQLMPDPSTATSIPSLKKPRLFLQCDVIEPGDGKAYDRDPRSIAKRAEAYLKASGLGDTAYFGPEPEFFIFDGVRWSNEPGKVMFEIEEYEAPWNSGAKLEGGNRGHRPTVKGGYFPVPPVDSTQDMRAEMSLILDPGIPRRSTRSGRRWPERNRQAFSTMVGALMDPVRRRGLELAHEYGRRHIHAQAYVATRLRHDTAPVHLEDGKNLSQRRLCWLRTSRVRHGGSSSTPCLNALTNPENSNKRPVPASKPLEVAYSARNARLRSQSLRRQPQGAASKPLPDPRQP